jgi:hypothetical protein
MNLAFAPLWSTLWEGAPWLPAMDALRLVRHASWALVCAAMALALCRRLPRLRAYHLHRRPWLPLAMALWACVPGVWGLAYWLGLAFQIPSLLATLWAATYLANAFLFPQWHAGAEAARAAPRRIWDRIGLAMLLVLGWLLLLDTFALLPWSVYRLGFAPVAGLVLLLVAVLPGVVGGGAAWRSNRGALLFLLALLLFMPTRWPTGNALDAVLDPGLWLYLHWLAWRRWRPT